MPENVENTELENGGVPQDEVVTEETQEQEAVDESPETDSEEKKTDDKDRSVYNCPDCKGEGATFPATAPEGVICPTCKGTGKV